MKRTASKIDKRVRRYKSFIEENKESIKSLDEEIDADRIKRRRAFWKDHGLSMPKIIIEQWKMIQKRDSIGRKGLRKGLGHPLKEKYMKNGKLNRELVLMEIRDIDSAMPGLIKEFNRLKTKMKKKDYKNEHEAWRTKFDVYDMYFLGLSALEGKKELQGILNKDKGIKLIPEKSPFNVRDYKITINGIEKIKKK